jgi:restriction system protein
MLGRKSIHAEECFSGGFIGVDLGIDQDLTGQLPEEWRKFNKAFVPIHQARHPDKSKVAAGLACGALWTVAKGIDAGSMVLCPDGRGGYMVGEVNGAYYYRPGEILPHRRPVQWLGITIDRRDMSKALQNSTGSIGTISSVAKHFQEIQQLVHGIPAPTLVSSEEAIEDSVAFAMEKHLEDFLVQNWSQTELGKEYNVYQEDGDMVGQQYRTDTGPMDILAVSKDNKSLLVVELKKGRASDAVVGQILRYMGFVQEELAEEEQSVRGVIIALDDDQRIRRALAVVPDIDFYRYQISFDLVKA